MYKLLDNIMIFIKEVMKNCKVEFTAGGTTLPEVHVKGGIFLADAFSQIPFVIEIMPLNYIFKKCTKNSKFTKPPENIKHFMYMDDIKLFAQNEKNEDSDTNNKNMQTGERSGILLW